MFEQIKVDFMLWRVHRHIDKRNKAFEKGDYTTAAYHNHLSKQWMNKLLAV